MTGCWNIFKTTEELRSSDTDVIKYVFTNKEKVAETVLYKYPDYKTRTVICCSVQSGCPVGCSFCGTGEQFIKNLTTEEIVQQVTYAITQACTSDMISPGEIGKLQIMFMSMGEPFLNYKRVEKAIRKLHNLFPNAALLISTVGIKAEDNFQKFIKLSQEIKTIGLQFSVHESTDTQRDLLIPYVNKMSLRDIKMYGERWIHFAARKAYINYCVHETNSSNQDVYNLSKLFNPEMWEVTLSVICEKDETIASSIERQLNLINDFSEKMLTAGFSIRVFNPAGQDDIGGGCGQLFHTQKWIKENINE